MTPVRHDRVRRCLASPSAPRAAVRLRLGRLRARRLDDRFRFDRAGFDLFSFPEQRAPDRLRPETLRGSPGASRTPRGWAGVVSHHEQFGALAAALVAEGRACRHAPEAVIACQHKLHARRVLQRVGLKPTSPSTNSTPTTAAPIPTGVGYPCYVKPVKAAFSVLARRCACTRTARAHPLRPPRAVGHPAPGRAVRARRRASACPAAARRIA